LYIIKVQHYLFSYSLLISFNFNLLKQSAKPLLNNNLIIKFKAKEFYSRN